MAKISVIMGTYNCKSKEMLYKSINSIQNQTYDDWELVICDDGSTNQTFEWLENIDDSRVKVCRNDCNKGLAFSLNRCIELSSGDFIARQDDDDESLPNRFQVELDFLNTNSHIDFVGSDAIVYDDEGEWGSMELIEFPSRKDFLWNSPFIHPTILFRKEALSRVERYRVSEETKRSQDYDLFMRMYANDMNGANIKMNLYKYRIERNARQNKRPFRIRVHEAIIRYKGFRAMGILFRGIPFIFKPIIISFFPKHILRLISKKKY